MGEYSWCFGCGNSKNNDSIYKCMDCGTMFCQACKYQGFLYVKCPYCRSIHWRWLGEIKKVQFLFK